MLLRAAPVLFVILWSSGFVAARSGTADAEPFTLLVIRFVLVLAILVPLAMWLGSRPASAEERKHAVVAGLLIHAVYLGGVFWAVRNGMSAGVVALIVSLQPVLTAVAAGPLLGEDVTRRHWLGLGIGLAGTALVLLPKLGASHEATPTSIVAAVAGLIGMTAGTLYQKRFATGIDLVTGAIWQYAGSLVVLLSMSLLFEHQRVTPSLNLALSLGWLVVVLSIGAIFLLMLLIRHNGVARISSLFYLVPAMTALLGYLVLGERLEPVQFAGMALIMAAVMLIAPASARR